MYREMCRNEKSRVSAEVRASSHTDVPSVSQKDNTVAKTEGMFTCSGVALMSFIKPSRHFCAQQKKEKKEKSKISKFVCCLPSLVPPFFIDVNLLSFLLSLLHNNQTKIVVNCLSSLHFLLSQTYLCLCTDIVLCLLRYNKHVRIIINLTL